MQARQSGGLLGQNLSGPHVLMFVVRAFASPLEAISRREFGAKYFGFPAVAALMLLPLWPALWPEGSMEGVNFFATIFMLMLILIRAESARAAKKGDTRHTRYNGWPRLAAIFRNWPETKIKGTVEPAIWLIAGAVIFQGDQALGSFLMVGALALFMLQSTIETVERAKVEELNDALIEQQGTAERFRALRQDHVR